MTVYSELSVKIEPEKLFTKKEKRILNILDWFIANFVVASLVVGLFRGTWHLVAIHYEKYFPFWETFILINVILFTFTYYRKELHEKVVENQRNLKSFWKMLGRECLVRIYHYLFAVCGITFWARIWEIVPRYIGKFYNDKIGKKLHKLNSTKKQVE